MEGYKIIPADPQDNRILTDIALASKRYWGYPEDWIELWLPDLTITEEYILRHDVFKLVENGKICGFCSLEWDDEMKSLEVAHLWLLPAYIGKKLGRYLLQSSLDKVSKYPARSISVIADPNASEFYEKFGFSKVGNVESKPAGRYLPKMVMNPK